MISRKKTSKQIQHITCVRPKILESSFNIIQLHQPVFFHDVSLCARQTALADTSRASRASTSPQKEALFEGMVDIKLY
jgi:hypothetical protein